MQKPKTHSNRLILSPNLPIHNELAAARTALALDQLVDVESLICVCELALQEAEWAKEAELENELIDPVDLLENVVGTIAGVMEQLKKPIKSKEIREEMLENLTKDWERINAYFKKRQTNPA